MRRPNWHVCSFVLLAVIGLTLLKLGAAISAPSPVFPAARSNTELARDFYDAVNSVLATGDPLPLAAVVSPRLVTHGLLPTGTGDLAALQDYLVAFHGAFPDAQLGADDLVAGREVVMVRVTLRVDGGAFAGLPVAAPVGFWGAVDTFRIADGRVAELWSDGGGGGTLYPLFASPPGPIEPGTTVAIDRFRLEAEAEAVAVAPLLLFLESGTLAFSLPDLGLGDGGKRQLPFIVSGNAGSTESRIRTVAPGRATALDPGDLLGIPTGTLYHLMVMPGQEAAGLAVEVAPPVADDYDGPAQPSSPIATATAELPLASSGGAEVRSLPVEAATDPLARWVAHEVGDGNGKSRRWAVGRMTLGPGSALTFDALFAPAMLAGEDGTIALIPAGESVVGASGRDGTRPGLGPTSVGGEEARRVVPVPAHAEILQSGESRLLAPGTRVTVRNVGHGPVTVLLIAAPAIDDEGVD